MDRVLCFALQLRGGELITPLNHTHLDLVCRNANEAIQQLAENQTVYWPVAAQKAIAGIRQAAKASIAHGQ